MQIEFVEFERHGAGGASISSHYFDLLVKLKNDQEHLFRNIQRNEYHNLFNFIKYVPFYVRLILFFDIQKIYVCISLFQQFLVERT